MADMNEERISDNYEGMHNSSANLPKDMPDLATIRDPDPDPDRDPNEIENQSQFGLHENDQYVEQGPMGDLDESDPYSNITSEATDDDLGDLDRTPGGEGFYSEEQPYGLDQPLAGPGSKNRAYAEKDEEGTAMSQDQEGYQK